MQLTPEQIAAFKTHGYVAVETFFNAEEVESMQAEVARLQRDGLLNNVATDGDSKTISQSKRNLQLCPMYKHSTLFRALPFAPKVTEAISQLLGDPVALRLDQVFLKPARDGAGTNWHQDNAYFKIEDPLSGTAMWIAVHDATVANGTIHVIPDRFEHEYEHSPDPDSNHHIRCYPEEERALPIELPAGGVAFFCYGTPHCTLGNKTERDRAGVALHFVRAEALTQDAQVGANLDPNYHPILTGPSATGGQKEYGTTVAGTWENELALAIG